MDGDVGAGRVPGAVREQSGSPGLWVQDLLKQTPGLMLRMMLLDRKWGES